MQFAAGAFGFKVFGFFNNHAGEQQQGNQVGDGHQAVEGVGGRPYQVQAGHGTQHYGAHVYQAVNQSGAVAKYIGSTFFTVVALVQNGGVGKENQADGYHPTTWAW